MSRKRTKRSDGKTADLKMKKVMHVSQRVITNEIMKNSHLDPNISMILPTNVSKIYENMMDNIDLIKNVQLNKDATYYNWKLGYTDLEKTIQDRRSELIDFVIKQKEINRKKRQRKSNRRRSDIKSKRKMTKSNAKGEKSEELNEINKLGNDGSVEIIDLGNVFNDENSSETVLEPDNEDIYQKTESEENTIEEKEQSENSNDKVDSLTKEKSKRKRKVPQKFLEVLTDSQKKLKKEIKESERLAEHNNKELDPVVEFVDLCEENESLEKESEDKRVLVRERNRLNKSNKEHTLVDKLLLGINCIRSWTENGLQLTKLADKDLILLNRRCASINCSLSQMSEHKDDNNNNTFLSVLLECSLFQPFLNQNSLPNDNSENVLENTAAQNHSMTDSKNNDLFQSYFNLHFQKSKQYTPSLYRIKNTLPSILLKSQQKINHQSNLSPSNSGSSNIHNHNTSTASPSLLQKIRKHQHHHQNKLSISTPSSNGANSSSLYANNIEKNYPEFTSATPNKNLVSMTPSMTTGAELASSISQQSTAAVNAVNSTTSSACNNTRQEPLPTASQLLKMKSKALAEKNANKSQSLESQSNLQISSSAITNVVNQNPMSTFANSLASATIINVSQSPIIYRTAPVAPQINNFIFPANAKFIPLNTVAPTVIRKLPANPNFITKVQKVTLHSTVGNDGHQSTTVSNSSANNQSIILKNLLQQNDNGKNKIVRIQNNSINGNSEANTSNNFNLSSKGMMSYSAFQSAKNRWQTSPTSQKFVRKA